MPKAYPSEFRSRAVRLVLERCDLSDPPVSEWVALSSVASQLGIGVETVRKWVRRSQIDTGQRVGLTSGELAEIKRLKKENHELRMANEILTTGPAFFASKLDRNLSK